MSSESESLTPPAYRPDIDGLRAVAVGGVILHHLFGWELLPGGYLGVDVFFVISGYLITNLIRRSRENFSLREFWFRRVRRLFPALATVLAVSLIAGWYLLRRRNGGLSACNPAAVCC